MILKKKTTFEPEAIMKQEESLVSNIEFILFDLDDTIIGSEKLYQRAYEKLSLDLKTLNLARLEVKNGLPPGNVAARNRLLYFKKYLEIKGEFGAARVLDLMDKYEVILRDFIEDDLIQSQNRETLLRLKNKYRMGIVTNENLKTQMLKLNQLDPEGKLFDFIITSEEVGFEKPAKQMVQRAMEQVNLGADKILMVGDSIENDLIPFSNFGCKILGTRQFRNESVQGSPFRWIDSLNEIL
jgi:putative hydrolase of the HAD superfamily